MASAFLAAFSFCRLWIIVQEKRTGFADRGGDTKCSISQLDCPFIPTSCDNLSTCSDGPFARKGYLSLLKSIRILVFSVHSTIQSYLAKLLQLDCGIHVANGSLAAIKVKGTPASQDFTFFPIHSLERCRTQVPNRRGPSFTG